MQKKKALDLFCGAGGATRGLQQAGFSVMGIDSREQPRYIGGKFLQDNALAVCRLEGFLTLFDFIWASPPCQTHSALKNLGNIPDYKSLIEPVRELIQASGVPFCIENVISAPLQNSITLCGAMFNLQTYRHRQFETSFPIVAPLHPPHRAKTAKLGRPVAENEYISVAGNFSGVAFAKRAMGIDWMTGQELSQAIPPAYSKYIGDHFLYG